MCSATMSPRRPCSPRSPSESGVRDAMMLDLQYDERRDHAPEPVRDNVTPLHRADEEERAWSRTFEATTDAAALIPEGEYQARVAAPRNVYRLFQSERLVLQF